MSIRPVGDLVTVETAVPIAFSVTVMLTLRSGASAEAIAAAAKQRIIAYCSGRMRWIGEGLQGPVWLVGRRIRRATIAAAALGADDNILEVEVSTPGADVNAPLAFDWDELLAGVGTPDFQPLPDNMTVHLFGAPRLEIVTVNTQVAAGELDVTDLPASNASPLELELARLSDRIEAIDGEHLMATAWNAAACPPELLPILAWSLSVDVWDDNWPIDVKRTAVEQSPAYHESKGTVRAIQDALKLLGCRTVVTDWWQAAPQRRRGTFNVTAFVTERREAGAPLISEALMRQAFQSVAMAKPKSRAFTIELAAGFSAGAGLSAAAEALQIACAAGPAAPFTLIGRGAGLAAALQAAQISRCKASAAPDLKPTGVGGLASAIAACQIARLNVELSVS